MQRAIFLAAVALVVAAVAVPVASSTPSSKTQRRVTGHITLRLRYKTSPWSTSLSLPLNRNNLKEFKLCGVFNWPSSKRFTCLGAGSNLPERTLLRMEQTPIANAMKKDDSPGWGLVGLSSSPLIKVPLSNTATKDVWGTFYYRVTLRDLSGKVLLTSNKVKLTWHKP